jgi:hypothetical protein
MKITSLPDGSKIVIDTENVYAMKPALGREFDLLDSPQSRRAFLARSAGVVITLSLAEQLAYAKQASSAKNQDQQGDQNQQGNQS